MERFAWEWCLLEWFNHFGEPVIPAIMELLTRLGSGVVAVGIFIVLYYAYNKDLAKRLAFIAMFSMLLNGALKSLFSATRPFNFPRGENLNVSSSAKASATGTTFPSGHSQNAGSLYGGIYLNSKKKWIQGICVALMIIVPISRMVLGVHFPGDVIVGLSLGIVSAVGINSLSNLCRKRAISFKWLYIGTLIIFIPFILINMNNSATADLFKSYGLLLGFVVATSIEERYINFTTIVKPWKKLVRIAIGVVAALTVQNGLKALFNLLIDNYAFFSSIENILNLIRYFLITFVCIAVIPAFFTKEGSQVDE